jgi:hypothetical protein
MSEHPLFSLRELMATVVQFLPAFLSGLLVLLVGLVLSWLAARVVVRVLIWLRLHRVVERLRWGRALGKGDIRHALYSLVGGLVGTFTFIIFLNRALELWGLRILSALLERLLLLVPGVLLAGLILLVGAGVAAVASRSVRRALFAEQMGRATLVARTVRAAVLVLTVAIALIELNIAPKLVTWAFLIAFGCLAVTFALAVGLGSRRAVEAMWEELLARRRDDAEERKTEPDER